MEILKFAFSYKKQIAIDKETKKEIIRYYPMVPCTLDWKGKRSKLTDGLLDSGCDGVVLPLSLAKFLELDLVLEEKPMKVVGGESFPNVEVSIPIEGDTPVLIGREPVFKPYEITFIESKRRFIMKPL
jgi:hypothetical protein